MAFADTIFGAFTESYIVWKGENLPLSTIRCSPSILHDSRKTKGQVADLRIKVAKLIVAELTADRKPLNQVLFSKTYQSAVSE